MIFDTDAWTEPMVREFLLLKGTNTQHSGHEGQIFKTEKTIEIQPVRPTKVCGKV